MKEQMSFEEAAKLIGIELAVVIEMIEHEWIIPVSEQMLDQEDMARARLIVDLRIQFGVNDEAIPVILHLADQLYQLRDQLSALKFGSEGGSSHGEK